MVFPFMIGEMIFIPKVASLLGLFGIFIAGLMERRQGHIGRIGIAANAILLWQIFFAVWDILPDWFQWYLNIGTVLMIIALVSYFTKLFRLPTLFYQVSYYLYGSFSIIFVVIMAFFLGMPVF